MDIGAAVKVLKSGGRVRRSHWNGPNMWISLTPGKNVPAEKFWSPHNRMFAEIQPDGCAEVMDHVTIKTADGRIVPWTCSQSDLLATDWEEI